MSTENRECSRCNGSGFDDASGFGDEVICDECKGTGNMAHYTDEELEARDAGEDAHAEGKPRSANPYSILSQKNLYTCWDEAWEMADNETDEVEDDDRS